MIAYHGTVAQGLTVLEPFANPHSNLKYPCVYLSTNKALASIYVWSRSREFKWMTFEIREDGMPIYNEAYKGGLAELYGGVSGCIYECDANFEVDENTTIKHAVISRVPVEVRGVDIVDDAYVRILDFARRGELVINRFEELSEHQKLRDRNMVLGAIERLDLLAGEHPMAGFVAERFPQLWQEALHDLRKVDN